MTQVHPEGSETMRQTKMYYFLLWFLSQSHDILGAYLKNFDCLGLTILESRVDGRWQIESTAKRWLLNRCKHTANFHFLLILPLGPTRPQHTAPPIELSEFLARRAGKIRLYVLCDRVAESPCPQQGLFWECQLWWGFLMIGTYIHWEPGWYPSQPSIHFI